MKRAYSSLVLRKCTEHDVSQIYEFQRIIIEGLENKEILRENSKSMFERCVQEPNLTLGVYDSGELVAIAILVDEKGNEEDLCLDLEIHKVDLSANFKLVMVKQEYRGNGFQKALMWVLEKYAYSCGIKHLCTTVSSKNVYSLNNIKGSDYEFDHHAIKYGGLSREVFVKNIYRSVSSYNKMILGIINSIEGKSEPNALVTEGINFDRCFQGDLTIASTGDVLEYEDTDSGKTYFGLLVKKFTWMVLIYIPEENSLQLKNVSDNINSLKLQKVWINTR